MLALPLQKLAFIVEKAREYDAEVAADPGAVSGSNPTDDGSREVLEDIPGNPTEQELRDAIDGLNVDERQELLALLWLGRGDFDAEGWVDALRQARDTIDATATDYLLGTPLLADYLEEGADMLGLSLEDFEGP
ncbi:MAG TPA: DUF3775 domain-containing protein [Stellaceae bacterium]|nr:DUF3775 domain-containing protein [Stellaceae bacterium]